MAYVFGFPKEVTNLIYDMRDWKLEDVKQNNGTPSCLALKSFTIKTNYNSNSPATYEIRVQRKNSPACILVLEGVRFVARKQKVWDNWRHCVFGFAAFDKMHGALVLPCPWKDPYL